MGSDNLSVYFKEKFGQAEQVEFNAQKEYDLYRSKLPESSHSEVHHHREQHPRSPACLLECVKWVLDVEECPIGDVQDFEVQSSMMDPKTTKNLVTIREPMVSYKHCTLGSPQDQLDDFDHLIREDRYAPECSTQRNSQQSQMQEE